jgi:feruloyl esterase
MVLAEKDELVEALALDGTDEARSSELRAGGAAVTSCYGPPMGLMLRAAYHAFLGALSMTLLACGSDGQDPPITEPPVETPQEACDALSGVTIGEAKLSDPTLVAAADEIGEHCKVTGLLGTSLRFEVYLPTEWNKKLLHFGGGGFNGAIPAGFLLLRPWDASGGYVTVASNGGHDDPSGAVFLDNPEVQKGFGYLQIHKVLGAVLAIMEERYGPEFLAASLRRSVSAR